MKCLLPLLFLFGLSSAEVKITEKKIQVHSDSSFTDVIVSRNYPESAKVEERQIWHLKSDQGAKILLTCNDLRISPSTDCEKGFLEVVNEDSTQKYCGSQSGLTVLSTGDEMTVTFELIWASGLSKCSVDGVKDDNPKPKDPKPTKPEPTKPNPNSDSTSDDGLIHLKLGADASEVIDLDVPENFNKKWSFATDIGNKLSVMCDRIFFLSDHTCRRDRLTFNTQNVCYGRYNYNYMSEGNTLTVEAVSSQTTGFLKCIVQAVNGPYFEQFKNPPSEEVHSGENGLGGGRKDTTCKCGWSKKAPARILHGKDTRDGQYPWMVLVLCGGGCGGSIITSKHVLTAAHCTVGGIAEKCLIKYGSNDMDKQRSVGVKRIIDHQYDRQKFLLNDISVLLVKEKIQFSENVGPICLTPERPNINHQYVTAMGWGWLGEGNGDTTIMQHTNLRVIDFPTCNFLWRRQLTDRARICALASNRTACSGDSGSSVVWVDPETNRYTQLGVKSFAAGCNTNKPLVNTYVPHYYDWIQKVISETDPSVNSCSKRG